MTQQPEKYLEGFHFKRLIMLALMIGYMFYMHYYVGETCGLITGFVMIMILIIMSMMLNDLSKYFRTRMWQEKRTTAEQFMLLIRGVVKTYDEALEKHLGKEKAQEIINEVKYMVEDYVQELVERYRLEKDSQLWGVI